MARTSAPSTASDRSVIIALSHAAHAIRASRNCCRAADAPLFPPPPTPSCSATAAAPRHAPRRASCARRRSPLPPRRRCPPSPWAPPLPQVGGRGGGAWGRGGASACARARGDACVVRARPPSTAAASRMRAFWPIPRPPLFAPRKTSNRGALTAVRTPQRIQSTEQSAIKARYRFFFFVVFRILVRARPRGARLHGIAAESDPAAGAGAPAAPATPSAPAGHSRRPEREPDARATRALRRPARINRHPHPRSVLGRPLGRSAARSLAGRRGRNPRTDPRTGPTVCLLSRSVGPPVSPRLFQPRRPTHVQVPLVTFFSSCEGSFHAGIVPRPVALPVPWCPGAAQEYYRSIDGAHTCGRTRGQPEARRRPATRARALVAVGLS